MDIWSCTPEQAIEATLGPVAPPPEPPVVPYDALIDILRDEWGIEVMWDGLRRFWYVGLTEEGVRKRDENEKLRELVRHLYTCMERQEPDGSLLCANCPYENESNECDYEQRMEELGVDV